MIKKQLLFFLIFNLILASCSKKTAEVKDYLEAIRIYTSKKSEVYDNLRSFTDLGPRYTGFNESVKVKKWMEEKIKSMDLKSKIQEFKFSMLVKEEHWLRVYSDTLKENTLEIPCETFEGLAGTRETSAFLTDSTDKDPAGKIMLMEIKNHEGLTAQIEAVAKKGVLGILCVYPFSNSILTAKLDPKNRIHCPVLCISQEEAMNLKAYHEQKPRRKIRMFSKQTEKIVKSFNLSCEIPGENPEKIQIFCHWDSWDVSAAVLENGSSVAISFEIMRFIKELKLPLKNSIEFVFLGASEQNEKGWKLWIAKNKLSNDFICLENMLEMSGITANEIQIKRLQKIQQLLKSEYDPSLTMNQNKDSVLSLHFPAQAIRFSNRIPEGIAANLHSDADNLDMLEESILMRTAALATMYVWALANT